MLIINMHTTVAIFGSLATSNFNLYYIYLFILYFLAFNVSKYSPCHA